MQALLPAIFKKRESESASQEQSQANALDYNEIQSLIDGIHARYINQQDGEVASYIPQLSKSNPKHFGIAILSAKG